MRREDNGEDSPSEFDTKGEIVGLNCVASIVCMVMFVLYRFGHVHSRIFFTSLDYI